MIEGKVVNAAIAVVFAGLLCLVASAKVVELGMATYIGVLTIVICPFVVGKLTDKRYDWGLWLGTVFAWLGFLIDVVRARGFF